MAFDEVWADRLTSFPRHWKPPSIAAAIVGCSLHGDPIPAEEWAMSCSPVDPVTCRSSAIGRWGRRSPRRVICWPTSRVNGRRYSFASLVANLGYNEPTIASLIGHKITASPAVHPFRRRRVAGRSRCRGECHHEAAGSRSGATPVAGSRARWSIRVGRIHRL